MQDLIIYTDGSCLNNPGPGGWSFIIVENQEITLESFGNLAQTTNNQMELQAVIEALKWMLKMKGPQAVATIFTDSRYVQQGITLWTINWKKNQWRTSQGQAVKNQEYWAALDRLNSILNISWQWVKAHHTDRFNICVDNLARQAAILQRSSHA